jgi:subtilisin family serine protease
MKWFFQPYPDGDGATLGDDDHSAPGLLGLPAALLERHGGRVLDPGHAGEVADYPTPRPTVYRARTLLVPDNLLRDGEFIAAVNDVLRHSGLELVPPEEGRDADLDTDRGDQRVFEALRQLPRPAVLVPRQGYRRPVEIDAWTALQTLRAATVRENPIAGEAPADREQGTDEAPADREQVTLDKAKVDRIELEHLLIGSPITGSPVDEGGGGIAGGSGNGSDVSGPSTTDSYLFNGGDPRIPVGVYLDPPPRRPAAECASRYGRRPLVAVLDTGVRAQRRWLDVTADGAGGYTMPGDGFVAVDDKIQAAIEKESQRAATHGDKPRQVIRDAWDKPIADNPLIGEANPALGHCTSIAGIVRQAAPEARVLAVRVMHSDDILYESDIICGLRHLAKRIALAEPDDLVATVDVVSLSFGYFSESQHDKVVTSGLWQAIDVLLSLGVVVVAAAGNYASSRKFYPAAFALKPVPADRVPVISVGALNPNGTKAMFSNDGGWVVSWALGACVVTAYPTDVDASRAPELRIPANREPPGKWPPGREALDPNDYSAGLVVWSGTSFSAPYAAALVARSLLEGAVRGLRLDTPGTVEKRRRAVAAYDNLPRSIT